MDHLKSLFIADLHLSELTPKTCSRFIHFLENEASRASALYILGDLFEYWIGDEMLNRPIVNSIANALNELKKKGIKTYFIYGNRDFLIGEKFLRASGLILIDEPHLLHWQQFSLIILHGDSLCTDDWPYQLYKKIVRQPIIKFMFLALPFSWRQKLANQIRIKSQKRQAAINNKQQIYIDVNPETVEKVFRHFDINIMVHGHTHQPNHHQKNKKNRYVLSDWNFEGNHHRGNYLEVNAFGIKAINLKK